MSDRLIILESRTNTNKLAVYGSVIQPVDMENTEKGTEKKGALPSYEEALVARSGKSNDQAMWAQPPPNPYALPNQPVVQQVPGQVNLHSDF